MRVWRPRRGCTLCESVSPAHHSTPSPPSSPPNDTRVWRPSGGALYTRPPPPPPVTQTFDLPSSFSDVQSR
eukprot:9284368-Pyramimonas_sp.AAC.1